MSQLRLPNKLIPVLLLAVFAFIPSVFTQSILSVSVSASKAVYSAGEAVSVSGKVVDGQNNPVFSAAVSIQVNDPQGKPVHIQLLYTDQTGAYTDSFILPPNSVPGSYTMFVSASKPGFSNGQTQGQLTVTVQTLTVSTTTTSPSSSQLTSQAANPSSPKCIIATATYGSELAPEVTLLRNFRDFDVLQTYAGKSFMVAFNAFYYSFSPNVASFIASHPIVKDAMKIILYPLIGVLYLTSRLFQLLSFAPEASVTISGTFAAFALGAVYLGPLASLASLPLKPRRIIKYRWAAAFALTIGLLSLGMILLAELLQAEILLMATTVGVILSFFALGAIAVARWAIGLRH